MGGKSVLKKIAGNGREKCAEENRWKWEGKVTGNWRKSPSQQIQELYSSLHIIRVIKYREKGGARSTYGGEEKCSFGGET
jgi:hypothetical protein